MDIIDLRSDTVTWPTPEMREAMAKAEVGDDVYGEDPTVNRLEALSARMTGQQAAVFVCSGTMGNLAAILAHCERGDEMILGQAAHTFKYEVGSASALGGVHPHTIPVQEDGTLALVDIRGAIRDASNIHFPPTRLVTIENTNGAGGLPLTPEYTQSVRDLCDQHGLKLHIDGARVFNAVAALDVGLKELTASADSVTFCLSKGLCAPAGALLCGSREFVDRARRVRKMLGGGMRQVGVLAAAGILAIERMAPRLAEDHQNAQRLAEELALIKGIKLDIGWVPTNMVFFSLEESVPFNARQLYDILDREFRIRLSVRGERQFRAVTHYWINADHVLKVAEAIKTVMERVVT